jgi:hypothetical protein
VCIFTILHDFTEEVRCFGKCLKKVRKKPGTRPGELNREVSYLGDMKWNPEVPGMLIVLNGG